MEKLIIGTGVVVAFIIAIAVVYAFGGLMFAMLWNWLVPSLWAAAPHLTWKMGIAASWLIGIAQGIFGGIKLNWKKED